ncbi:MAG: hypothetical protein LQ346_002331 [Caloplaca aetnensis]|nr:MAG: hypothetical protein LQ346_002331 [Caloplaca aetnensis]
MPHCSPCTTIMSVINIALAHGLPLTWTRLHHWLHLISDQNIDLYTPQNLLLSTIPIYLEFFLLILSASYHHPLLAHARDPLNDVTDDLLFPVFVFTAMRWLLTAVDYVLSQPGIGNKLLALVDLLIEQVFVSALVWGALHLAMLSAYPAFGWDRVRRAFWAYIGYQTEHA